MQIRLLSDLMFNDSVILLKTNWRWTTAVYCFDVLCYEWPRGGFISKHTEVLKNRKMRDAKSKSVWWRVPTANYPTRRCVSTGTLVLNEGATDMAPTQKEQPLLSSRRWTPFLNSNDLGTNTNLAMCPDGVPKPRTTVFAMSGAIYCYAVLKEV